MVPFEGAVRGSLERSRDDRAFVQQDTPDNDHANRVTPLSGTQLRGSPSSGLRCVQGGVCPMLRSGGASASADNRCVLSRSMSGTISTGHEAARTTDRAVLPSIRLAIHERWWSPSTISDPSTERAIWRMTSAGVASSVIWRNELRSPFALRWAVTASRSIHASSAMAAIAAVADLSLIHIS